MSEPDIPRFWLDHHYVTEAELMAWARAQTVREQKEREVRNEEAFNADAIDRYHLRGITPPDF